LRGKEMACSFAAGYFAVAAPSLVQFTEETPLELFAV